MKSALVIFGVFSLACAASITSTTTTTTATSTSTKAAQTTVKPPVKPQRLVESLGKDVACEKLGADPEKITSFCECVEKQNPELKIKDIQACLPGDGSIGEKVVSACQAEPDEKVTKCLDSFIPSIAKFLNEKDHNQKSILECSKILDQDDDQ